MRDGSAVSQTFGTTRRSWVIEAVRRVLGWGQCIRKQQRSGRVDNASLENRDNMARVILNTAMDGIITFDARGNINGFNPAAESLFRCSAAGALGEHISCFLPDLLATNTGTGDELGIGFAPLGREFLGRRQDGSTFPAELTVSEGVLAGRRIFACAVRDITERKRTQEAQRLFLTCSSLGLGNALAAIAGYAHELSDLAEGEAVSMRLERITWLAHVLSSTMRDLVVYSGIAGSPNIMYGPVPLHTALVGCAKEFQRECRSKNLSLRITVPEGVTVISDRVKLTRIVDNLLSNAVRYTNNGEIELTADVTDAEIAIRVRDTGIGIPAADLPHIFEPYFRHEEARALEPWGAGLGLTTVKQFAELLGGTVRVKSEPGVGSEFVVSLPRKFKGTRGNRGETPEPLPAPCAQVGRAA